MSGIKILGTGSYVPDFVVTNDMFAQFLDTSDEWISTRTGIKSRPINIDKPNFYMGLEAAKKALANAKVEPSEIDLIIVTTVTPDFYYPSMSCLIQHFLGADGCMTLDSNSACTGFIYGIDMARRYLCTGDVDTVLLVSSEMMSNQVDYTDRATCVLFGDGAAAVVLKRDDEKLYSSFLGANGEDGGLLSCRISYDTSTSPFRKQDEIDNFLGEKIKEIKPDFVHMNGREVYKFAVDALPRALTRACEKAGITPKDLDIIIPHQANMRIIEKAVSNMDVSMDKVYVNLPTHGNTSSASIPICLDELAQQGRLAEGTKVGVVGFGAGFTYGAAVFEI